MEVRWELYNPSTVLLGRGTSPRKAELQQHFWNTLLYLHLVCELPRTIKYHLATSLTYTILFIKLQNASA